MDMWVPLGKKKDKNNKLKDKQNGRRAVRMLGEREDNF